MADQHEAQECLHAHSHNGKPAHAHEADEHAQGGQMQDPSQNISSHRADAPAMYRAPSLAANLSSIGNIAFFFVMLFCLLHTFLNFIPHTNNSRAEVVAAIAGLLHCPVVIKMSYTLMKQYGTSAHEAPLDPNVRLLYQWSSAFFLVDMVNFFIYPNYGYAAHHAMSIILLLPALLFEYGQHMVAPLFFAEVTAPLHQLHLLLKFGSASIPYPALSAYLLGVDEHVVHPVYVIAISFVRFTFLFGTFLSYVKYVISIIPAANRRDTTQIPLWLHTIWSIGSALMFVGTAVWINDNSYALRFPDFTALVNF
eukprot:m.344865 g.344865  ORF g.344865 m.344865 type:complete len:310 (+) comp55802_c1_seq5:72-1001(+)